MQKQSTAYFSVFLQWFPITLLFISIIDPTISVAQQKSSGLINNSHIITQSSTVDCECDTIVVRSKSGNFFYPQLQTITTYPDFMDATGWQLPDKDKSFRLLFVKNYRADISSTSQGAIFSILSYKAPIKLVHPNGTFTINLTPCVNRDHVFEVPMVAKYSNPVMHYDRRFDYKKFDHSAKSYLHVFIAIGGRSDDILKQLLQNMIENDYKKLTGFKRFITKINKKYNLDITLNGTDKSVATQNIPSMINQIEAKKIQIESFINDEFIVTDEKPHAINTEEKERLKTAIANLFQFTDFDEFDKNFLHPKCEAGAFVKQIGIEINKEVLRKWDKLKNGPWLDSVGQPIRLPILADVSKVDFSSQYGISASIKSLCSATSEISGTGITLDFDNADLIDVNNNSKFDKHNYPLFLLKPPPGKNLTADGMVIFKYDSLINDFSGLLVHTAKMYIPFRNTIIAADVKELIINNKLISGTILIAIEQLTTDKSPTFKIITANQTMNTNVTDIETYLKKHGLKDLSFQITNHTLFVNFKKIYAGVINH